MDYEQIDVEVIPVYAEERKNRQDMCVSEYWKGVALIKQHAD